MIRGQGMIVPLDQGAYTTVMDGQTFLTVASKEPQLELAKLINEEVVVLTEEEYDNLTKTIYRLKRTIEEYYNGI